MKNLDLYGKIAWVLVIIGAINWFLVGLFNVNIVAGILGVGFLSRLVYILVGVGAGYLIYLEYLAWKGDSSSSIKK